MFFCLGWGYLGGLGSPRNGFGLEIAEIRIMTLDLVSADNDIHDDDPQSRQNFDEDAL